MRRNSTHLELITPGATTWLPWISDPGSNRVDGLGDEPGLSFGATWISDPGSNRVDGYPNFDGFTGQSRTIREAAWQAFLDSGEELEVIPDPEPPIPEPDWTAFNLAMIPPSGESEFEFWLDQFKILYQSSLATAAASGNATDTQRIYDLLKLQHPPTAEQITEWQGIADANHVPLRF